VDWRKEVAAKVVNPRSGALVAVSAMAAAAAWREIEHRHVLRADLPETHVRVERLSDLRYDRESLAAIEAGLRAEWGAFALFGFESVAEMAAQAGATTFVARQQDGERFVVKGAVQTLLVDACGDAEVLRAAYPTFQALTGREVWRRSRRRGGDTAVLLQITVFGRDERGGGLGSLLRNAALNMLSKDVRFALTTTPVDLPDGGGAVRLDDASSFTPAMRFHARAGAAPALLLPGYKAGGGEGHGEDVVMMRYARDEAGEWPAPKPAMRLRSAGPMQERLSREARRLRSLRVRRPVLRRLALPRVHLRAA